MARPSSPSANLTSAVGTVPSGSPAAALPGCDASDSEHFYFREGALGGPSVDALKRYWYSSVLRAMREPALSCGDVRAETYRFLWLRSWGRPVAVRFQLEQPTISLNIVELEGAGGYEPGPVSRSAAIRLSPSESAELRHALDAASVWAFSPDTRQGLDGAQWVLEARRGNAYRIVEEWSPRPAPFRALGELLIRRARVELDSSGNALY